MKKRVKKVKKKTKKNLIDQEKRKRSGLGKKLRKPKL